jgi:hypothetical protein
MRSAEAQLNASENAKQIASVAVQAEAFNI